MAQALQAGYKSLLKQHTKGLEQAGDTLYNYKRDYIERVIAKLKQLIIE